MTRKLLILRWTQLQNFLTELAFGCLARKRVILVIQRRHVNEGHRRLTVFPAPSVDDCGHPTGLRASPVFMDRPTMGIKILAGISACAAERHFHHAAFPQLVPGKIRQIYKPFFRLSWVIENEG